MDDLGDLRLRTGDSDAPPAAHRTGRPSGLWVVAAALAAAAAVAVYIVFFQARPGPVADSDGGGPPTASTAQRAHRPLGPDVQPIDLPPLDQSDAVVRRLVEAVSRHPAVIAWLSTQNLIRTFTVAMLNVADGTSPAQHLPTLRPKTPFGVVERADGEYIAPGSYDRYTVFADAAGSIDASGAARLYATLRPRIDEAYHDLGFPNQSFDDVVRRAIVALLQTPTVDAPIRLRHKGIGYAYEDQRLEELTGPQKLLLRMGPRNARAIKERLRAIGIALGMNAHTLQAR